MRESGEQLVWGSWPRSRPFVALIHFTGTLHLTYAALRADTRPRKSRRGSSCPNLVNRESAFENAHLAIVGCVPH